jgi:hypothetical protein
MTSSFQVNEMTLVSWAALMASFYASRSSCFAGPPPPRGQQEVNNETKKESICFQYCNVFLIFLRFQRTTRAEATSVRALNGGRRDGGWWSTNCVLSFPDILLKITMFLNVVLFIGRCIYRTGYMNFNPPVLQQEHMVLPEL